MNVLEGNPSTLLGSEIDMYEGVMDDLAAWFKGEFSEQFTTKYGDDANVAVIIMRHSLEYNWLNPYHYRLATLIMHDIPDAGDFKTQARQKIRGPEGLVQNVYHKLRFVLRTGLDSREAKLRPDLLEEGDFPYEGAGTYRGYIGGASGLKEESDWWVFCRVIDKLIELKGNAVVPAIEASKSREPDRKYLRG